MDELIKAIKIRRRYNSMPFKDFIKEYEKHFNVKVSDDVKRQWKFIGLNNDVFLINNQLL